VKHVRKRLTYANVMSSIAVFFVLGGGVAFAALGKNTVGTAQLKRNSVKVGKIAGEAVKAGKLAKNAIATNRLREGVVSTPKLADLSVTSGKLANFSVLGTKLAANAVATGNILNDAVATDKIANDAVDSSKIGDEQVKAAELGKTTQVTGAAITVAGGAVGAATVSCPAGSQVLSGGGATNNTLTPPLDSVQSGNGWLWFVKNNSGANATVVATAVCLNE
jgi:hypothetical protein